ncbi:hypothetical protein Pfo_010840 [Paulownia fortunei]|nr:hypothetical protein Pfo_010840 [Paulownia fortunei]
MNSGFQIPDIEHQQQHAILLSMNQTHILEQIHGTLPATQQLFLDQPLFLPPHQHQQSRLNHQYVGGAAGASSSFFPVNFKLGLNEICATNDNKDGTVGCINEEEDALLRGSEQYEVPEARQCSLGMPHCWQNQEDSAIIQPPLWEPLPAEVSNENSDTVDKQEHREMNQIEALTNCLESKSRVLFGELEAIYKRISSTESNQTGLCEILPVNPVVFDHGYSEASIGEEASASMKIAKGKRKKRRKETSYNDQLINPMAQFFEGLVKQVMDHQENLQKKFAEVIERLDGERREREEAWRNHELAHFEQEAEARARERASAASREATIVSYLEKITGQRISFPPFNPTEITSTNASHVDFQARWSSK